MGHRCVGYVASSDRPEDPEHERHVDVGRSLSLAESAAVRVGTSSTLVCKMLLGAHKQVSFSRVMVCASVEFAMRLGNCSAECN